MANVLIVLGLMNVFAKTDGMAKIVKKKWKCAQWQRVRTMPAVSIYSKTISAFVQKELTENNAKLHQSVVLAIHVRTSNAKPFLEYLNDRVSFLTFQFIHHFRYARRYLQRLRFRFELHMPRRLHRNRLSI